MQTCMQKGILVRLEQEIISTYSDYEVGVYCCTNEQF